METLIAGCTAFLVTHLGMSSRPFRGFLHKLLGQKGFLLVYSLIAAATLGLMIYGYVQVPHTQFLWHPTLFLQMMASVVLLIALFFFANAMMVKKPTQAEGDETRSHEVTGFFKVTRHPLQWAILLFAGGHLLANGDVASICFFGTLVTVALFGMVAMDARKRREADPRWFHFMETSSTVPFLAMARGTTRSTRADINWTALIAAIALYVALYWLHDMVSGGVHLPPLLP